MKVRIRTQNLLNVKNLYKLRKAAYIAQSCTQTCAKAVKPTQSRIQLRTQTATDLSNKSTGKILSVMAHIKKDKSTQVNSDWKKSRKVNAPISLEDLVVNELPWSLEDGNMRGFSVCTDPTNEDSTRSKRKIRTCYRPLVTMVSGR